MHPLLQNETRHVLRKESFATDPTITSEKWRHSGASFYDNVLIPTVTKMQQKCL
jgi:hypothetical protein